MFSILIYFLPTCKAREAFKIASTITPTSANTASHRFARPKGVNMSTNSFTARANTMFCRTIRRVR